MEKVHDANVLPLNEVKSGLRCIGNTRFTKQDRAFEGNIDDVRFFNQALSAESIEKIRQADVKNEPIALP